jgi:hypothetical protein
MCRRVARARSGCDQNDLPAGHAADDHGVDHDRSGVASAAWFRRRQSGESGGRSCAGQRSQGGAGQRSQDGGETGDEAGVMDTVPRDSRCGSGPIMQSYSPAASGVSGTPIGSDSMSG